MKEVGACAPLESPSFILEPRASARGVGIVLWDTGAVSSFTIRPLSLHDHVHTIYYSPRCLSPRRSSRPVANGPHKAVERRQPQHSIFTFSLGMRIFLPVNGRQTLSRAFCLVYRRFQSSPSEFSFSLLVCSCSVRRCRGWQIGEQLRVEMWSRAA